MSGLATVVYAPSPMPTSADPICGLCDTPGPTEARNFGLDLCEPCTAGYLTGRLGHWGAEIEVEELDTGSAEDKLAGALLRGKIRADLMESDTVLRVGGHIEGMPPLIATFSAKTLKSRMLGMFRRRFTTGDPLFDTRVEVETRTEALVRELVSNDGFQSAVMTLVTHCGAFEVKPGRVEAIAALTELDLRSEVPLAVGAVLRHLANRA